MTQLPTGLVRSALQLRSMRILPATANRGVRFLGIGLLMTLAFVGFGAQPASAHNALVTSVPANAAVLTQVPSVWSLTFTKDVPLDSASAELVASTGVRTALPAPTYGASKKEILFALPPDLNGAMTGRWRLVGTDGHVITERVSFTVNVASVAPSADGVTTTTVLGTPGVMVPTEVMTENAPTSEPVRWGLRTFGYAALLIVGGLLFTELFVAQAVLGAARAREALFASAAVLAAVSLAQALIFLDDSRDFGVASSVFHILEAFNSTAGSMYFVRFLTTAVLLVGIVRAKRATSPVLITPPILALSIAYLVSLAYTSHSRSMAWPVLGVPAGVIHTAATAAWLGGLIVFILFVIPSLQPAESFDAFRRFGDMAKYAVIAMLVTGVIQTLRLHGNLLTLFTQTHGRWLLLKLVLVALMLKIGDINRRRLLRKIPTDDVAFAGRVALLRRASITEIVNGGLVMLVTAFLVSSSFN
jgi:copper transport protein